MTIAYTGRQTTGTGASAAVLTPKPAYLPSQPWPAVTPTTKPSRSIAVVPVSDSTPPITNITVSPTLTKISRAVGRDVSALSFQSDEDYQAYQLRVVPNATSPVTAGTQIEAGGAGSAGIDRAVDVTDDELIAAGGVEGGNVVKVFVQDLAGNWST